MKISFSVLLSAEKSFQDLSQKEFPMFISYRISKNMTKIDNEMKHFNKLREQLFVKYGEKLSDRNSWKIKEECIDVFTTEYQKLCETECDIEFLLIPIKPIESMNIKPEIIKNLDFIFIEKENER